MKGLQVVSSVISHLLQFVLIAMVTLYRYLISPILHMVAPGSGCRFQPSCSSYALTALRRHGPLKGSWLAFKRLCRCQPWGGHGYDPVPDSCSCTQGNDPQHPSTLMPSRDQGSHPPAVN